MAQPTSPPANQPAKMMPAPDWPLLSAGGLLVGISKAGFGGGTGALVAPLLSLRMPSRQVIGLMLPMLLATDAINVCLYWQQWSVVHWLWLTGASAGGILAGGRVLGRLDDAALRRLIGCVAVGFAVLQIYRDPRAPQPHWMVVVWFGLAMGFMAGVFSVIAHVGGILTTMYLLTQHLTKEQFVATAAAVYLFQNVFKLYPYLSQKLVTREGLAINARLSPLLVVGALVGRYLNHNLDPYVFNRAVLVLMFGTGAYLLLRRPRADPDVSDTIEFVTE